MGAGAEVFARGVPAMDVQYRHVTKDVAVTAVPTAPPGDFHRSVVATVESVTPEIAAAESGMDLRSSDAVPVDHVRPPFVPSIRSGSFADIGPRNSMEDEHIRIDDLAAHLGSMFCCPTPSAFYGVFDGHGGSDAAAYVRKHAVRLFFREADFPRTPPADDGAGLPEELTNSVRKAFLLADDALADDCSVSSISGTTALTALVLGRLLLIANAGDCRAVLCRKGEAVDMSQDHKPVRASERARVEACGGFVDDGYLNGVISVTRALGDWEMKLPRGKPSPLIAEPEVTRAVLTEEDEFLIMGCDGIWDVMSSQHAVGVVRRGLRRHGDPGKCARELVMEALRLNTFDNLTVIVVCFSPEPGSPRPPPPRLRHCSLSAEALCSLRSWLDEGDGSRLRPRRISRVENELTREPRYFVAAQGGGEQRDEQPLVLPSTEEVRVQMISADLLPVHTHLHNPHFS